MARAEDARECLIRDVRQGGTTLVLGAGVTGACHVATWRELATRLWKEAFGSDLPEGADDPRFYPFVFERVQQAMPEQFGARLKQTLYARHRLPTRDELASSKANTLAVLARVIASESRLSLRRLVRIITLNVDDVLERAVALLVGPAAPGPALRPIVRASINVTHAHAKAAIPIYHLHGYLSSDGNAHDSDQASNVLVFTDLQYWASAAVPSSHMNRTFSFALHDSHCVFIGTSMADLNIWRWLALRTFEIAADLKHQTPSDRLTEAQRATTDVYRDCLDRHYWITASAEPADNFLSECLALRGVRTVRIDSWEDSSFDALMAECFPDQTF